MENSTQTITITNSSENHSEFASFLESSGYNVEYGIENAVNGNGCSYDLEANEIHNNLWNSFCNQ